MTKLTVEDYWCMVGDAVNTWFLYNSMMEYKDYIELCKKVREDND